MEKQNDDRAIRKLLGPKFRIQEHPTSNDTFKVFTKSLDERNIRLDAQGQWRAAWQRFENTSEQYIQRITAIRIDNKDPLKLQKHRTEYQRRAVRNFLPYLRNRLHYLKWRAKYTTNGAIKLLEQWKSDLHLRLPKIDTVIYKKASESHSDQDVGQSPKQDRPVHPANQDQQGDYMELDDHDDFTVLHSEDELDFNNWERSINSGTDAEDWERSSFLHAYRDAESEYERNNTRSNKTQRKVGSRRLHRHGDWELEAEPSSAGRDDLHCRCRTRSDNSHITVNWIIIPYYQLYLNSTI